MHQGLELSRHDDDTVLVSGRRDRHASARLVLYVTGLCGFTPMPSVAECVPGQAVHDTFLMFREFSAHGIIPFGVVATIKEAVPCQVDADYDARAFLGVKKRVTVCVFPYVLCGVSVQVANDEVRAHLKWNAQPRLERLHEGPEQLVGWGHVLVGIVVPKPVIGGHLVCLEPSIAIHATARMLAGREGLVISVPHLG